MSFKSHRIKGLEFILELAVMVQRSRGIGQCHIPPLYPRGRNPAPIVQGAVWGPSSIWTGTENLARTGMRYPDRPVRSESSVTGFLDETHFNFDVDINKYSVRIWPAENPRLTDTKPTSSTYSHSMACVIKCRNIQSCVQCWFSQL